MSKAAKRLGEAARQEDQARRDLYAAIKRAHQKNASLREIARAAELSHARVAQILRNGR